MDLEHGTLETDLLKAERATLHHAGEGPLAASGDRRTSQAEMAQLFLQASRAESQAALPSILQAMACCRRMLSGTPYTVDTTKTP